MQTDIRSDNSCPQENYRAGLQVHFSPQAGPLAGLSIFVADDEFINRFMLTAALQQRGGLVTACEDGLELIRAIVCCRPDVVLMDIRMPVLDGLFGRHPPDPGI